MSELITFPVTANSTMVRLNSLAKRFGSDGKTIPPVLAEYVDQIIQQLKANDKASASEISEIRTRAFNQLRIQVAQDHALQVHALRNVMDSIANYNTFDKNADLVLSTMFQAIKDIGPSLEDMGLAVYNNFGGERKMVFAAKEWGSFMRIHEAFDSYLPKKLILTVTDITKFTEFLSKLKTSGINLDDDCKKQLSIALAEFLENISFKEHNHVAAPSQTQLRNLLELFDQLGIELRVHTKFYTASPEESQERIGKILDSLTP